MKNNNHHLPLPTSWFRNAAGGLAISVLLAGCATTSKDDTSQHEMPMSGQAQMQIKMQHLVSMAPYRGYLAAHRNVSRPLDLLGGPVKVRISQSGGGVFVSLPDNRRLDPDVFGQPGMERAFAGTPGINGVPPMARGVENGHYTHFKHKSPFGDKYIVMKDGMMRLEAVDATATDAATTKDSVKLMASWKDKAGNTYEVRCCKMLASHGAEFPTFGGVVTNHILHGSSRLGTALMPTEYTYLAFWGMGEVRKNGQTLDKPRLIHGMLTEYVRTSGYQLGFDKDITPTRRQFHLMVPPMMPDMAKGRFHKKAVNTGFKLPNGMMLPFWHVMFENLTIQGQRGE